MQVLHRCDVRHCVNPDHLFLGTQADNMADMVEKGRERHPVGIAHGRAKLTEQDVYIIRAAPGSQQAIADQYGVKQTTISSIKRRRIWRHLP
jgi:DNA invertase Pin-like site-specific DNA recombinase